MRNSFFRLGFGLLLLLGAGQALVACQTECVAPNKRGQGCHQPATPTDTTTATGNS